MNRIEFPTVYTDEQSAILRAWGVQVLEKALSRREEAGRFVLVQAPDGWKLVRHPGHAMYRQLLDARGFLRASIFAKQEPWDQRICVHSLGHGLSFDYVRRTDLPEIQAVGAFAYRKYEPIQWRLLLGSSWVLMKGEPLPYGSPSDIDMSRYPDWRDYSTYWDMPIPPGAEAVKPD